MEFLSALMPARWAIIAGGALGTAYSFLFGELDHAFTWLFVMMIVDYTTGIIQAIHNHAISSKVGFRGIVKKVIIITIVVLSHGLAKMINLSEIETAVIFAFALNEMYSILENIERAGYGSVIPDPVRKILDIVKDKEDEIIDKIKK